MTRRDRTAMPPRSPTAETNAAARAGARRDVAIRAENGALVGTSNTYSRPVNWQLDQARG